MYKVYEVCVVCNKIRDGKNGWVLDPTIDCEHINTKRNFTLCAECYMQISPQSYRPKKQKVTAMPRLAVLSK